MRSTGKSPLRLVWRVEGDLGWLEWSAEGAVGCSIFAEELQLLYTPPRRNFNSILIVFIALRRQGTSSTLLSDPQGGHNNKTVLIRKSITIRHFDGGWMTETHTVPDLIPQRYALECSVMFNSLNGGERSPGSQ